jgi:hypothetical protein
MPVEELKFWKCPKDSIDVVENSACTKCFRKKNFYDEKKKKEA